MLNKMLRITTITLLIMNLKLGRSAEIKCPRPCRCDEDRQTVFCNYKSLIHVPFGIPKDTKILHLQGNKIISSPSLDAVLSELKSLEKLDLTENDLTSFPRGLPSSLKQIILKSNDVKYIGKEAFHGLSSLALIRLDNNSISNEGLSRSAFTGAQNLTTLTLTNNKLTAIPSGLPSSLKLLHLNKNQISQIRVINLRGLTELIRLDLSENKIFDEGIQDNSLKSLRLLKNLDLSDNYLRDVPHGIPKSVTYLSLARNQIRYIYATQPDVMRHKKIGSFQDMTKLVQLDLSNNLLQSVETDAFRKLNNLLLIRFQNNPWKCDCHLKYFLNFISSSKLIKNDMRHIVCVTPTKLEGVTINNLDSDALICDQNSRNFTIAIAQVDSTSITFNWTKHSYEAIPPFVRNFVMYGTLQCNEKNMFYSCEERIKDVKYIKELLEIDGYKELKSNYGTSKATMTTLDNLLPNHQYVFCPFDSSNNPSKLTYNQCVTVETLPELKASQSNIFPVWIIIICTASIFVVAMSAFALLLCRKKHMGNLHKGHSLPNVSPHSVDSFQREYVGRLLRKEGVLADNEVVMRNNTQKVDDECRKSTTLDACKEFNFTLVNHKNGVRMSTISTTANQERARNRPNKTDESFSSCRTTTSTINSSHDRPYFAFKTEPRPHEQVQRIAIDAFSLNYNTDEYLYESRRTLYNHDHYCTREAASYYV